MRDTVGDDTIFIHSYPTWFSQEKIVRYAPVSAIREYMNLQVSASPKLLQSLDIHSLIQVYTFFAKLLNTQEVISLQFIWIRNGTRLLFE